MNMANRLELYNLLNSSGLQYDKDKSHGIFIDKIGSMIWKNSQEEIFIEIKKNKILLSVLFEMSCDKNLEIKKMSFDILFSLFSNCSK